MKIHLVDGTYELFRQHYGAAGRHRHGVPAAATVGVLRSTLQLLADGATHVAVATDHVVESFRNQLWPGYKTAEGMPEELLAQFDLLEVALGAMGVVVWPMVEFEADDALASAADRAARDPRVEQVLICTADKDLAQCVSGTRVVQFDRRQGAIVDEEAVVAKFGVRPASIADYLALVGDSADGFPGLAGWGAKSASAVLARYGHLEHIPADPAQWEVPGLRGAPTLARTLVEHAELARLFRRIATVVTEVDVGGLDDWHWRGPHDDFAQVASELGVPELAERADALASRRLR